jgi:2-keto-4-pentenoate hydratase/2-oxohepta-3-ene-1,7-dioic acid hydratase in catechol pathway
MPTTEHTDRTRPDAGRGMARGLTLLTLRRDGAYRLGVKTRLGILDVPDAARRLGLPGPSDMDDLLQNQDGVRLQRLVNTALESPAARPAFLDESRIEYGPVVTRPEKILCVGLNFRQHAAEVGKPAPPYPVIFGKFNNALNHHKGVITLPVGAATKFDYEAELVIVMGRRARDVSEADALDYVAGYSTGNDFSARDAQMLPGGQWLLGKTSDQFAPVGPYLVTADQVDPDNLRIECRVNGETRQNSSTSDFIFTPRQVISYISRFMTLKPGDIIFTGTPQGVILGYPPERQVWLKPGDVVACSVEHLGELEFTLA